MILVSFLLVGVYTAVSGPAWDGWRHNRKRAKEFPTARVTFCLPSALESATK